MSHRLRTRGFVGRSAAALLCVVALVAGACSGGGGGGGSKSSSAPIDPRENIKGQTITVLLPEWANIPDEMVQQFEQQSGVTVDLNISPWDAIRNKISIAGAANSQLADVVEFDWSWTGQFGGAGWFVPLEQYLGPSQLPDMTNNNTFSLNGHLYGSCYNNDFRLFQYNKKYFDQAGIQAPPATFDELHQDLAALKQKGIVQSPFAWPLEPTEDNPQAWYLLVLAMGGQLFDPNNDPQFAEPDSPGYKALDFLISAYKEGLIEPGAVSMSNEAQGDWWRGGNAAVTYGAPSDLVTSEDPKQSKIVGQAAFMLVPGVSGPGNTYGLPEALAIMSSSKHKAAALAFIKWWMEPATQEDVYANLGLLPCRQLVFESLVQQGKLLGGDVMLEELKHIVPLFPQGAPTWYTRFSTEAASLINAAAKGNMTVAEALDRLAETAKSLNAGG
jgi:multiple sugar transport system substrate-binding protein